MGLNPKQELFCTEYIVDLNATQAAVRAGYSERSAADTGCTLLKNPDVVARVRDLMQSRAERVQLDSDYVVRNLMEVVARSLQQKPVMVYDPAAKGQVQATDEEGNGVYQFDSYGANKALELLGKHLGLFKDRLQVEDASPLATLRGFLDGDPQKS